MAVNVISKDEIIVFDSTPDLHEASRFLQGPFRGDVWRVALTVHGERVRGGTPPNPSGPARPGAVSLFGSHARDLRGPKGGRGWGLQDIRDRITAEGGLRPALESLANERPGVDLQGVTRVEVHLWREA